MTRHRPPVHRLLQAGIDLGRFRAARIVVKIDDVPADRFGHHPAWFYLRAASPLGLGLCLCGAADWFDEIDRLSVTAPCLQVPGLWVNEAMAALAGEATVVVDMTNNVASKRLSAHLAARCGAGMISLQWGRAWVEMQSHRFPDGRSSDFALRGGVASEPLAPIANVAAGLTLVESLAHLHCVDLLEPADQSVTYNLATASRAGTDLNTAWPDEAQIENTVIDVVGCGALGTAALASLAPMLGPGTQTRLFDFDLVGPENLALQGYVFDDIGRMKADALRDKLRKSHFAVDVQPFACRYEDRPRNLAPPDLRLSCVDTFAGREYLDRESASDGVPLVDGALAPLQARVIACVPGRTTRLSSRIRNLHARAEEEQSRASCAAEPGVPGVNLICGGMLVGEALRVMRPELGEPCAGTCTFDARFPARFGVQRSRGYAKAD